MPVFRPHKLWTPRTRSSSHRDRRAKHQSQGPTREAPVTGTAARGTSHRFRWRFCLSLELKGGGIFDQKAHVCHNGTTLDSCQYLVCSSTNSVAQYRRLRHSDMNAPSPFFHSAGKITCRQNPTPSGPTNHGAPARGTNHRDRRARHQSQGPPRVASVTGTAARNTSHSLLISGGASFEPRNDEPGQINLPCEARAHDNSYREHAPNTKNLRAKWRLRKFENLY